MIVVDYILRGFGIYTHKVVAVVMPADIGAEWPALTGNHSRMLGENVWIGSSSSLWNGNINAFMESFAYSFV